MLPNVLLALSWSWNYNGLLKTNKYVQIVFISLFKKYIIIMTIQFIELHYCNDSHSKPNQIRQFVLAFQKLKISTSLLLDL